MKTRNIIFVCLLIAQLCGYVSGFAVVKHYDSLCKSYGFDKGVLFTTQGVFCERTVTSSWEVPYLPLEGARRVHEYLNNPDPRFHPAPTQTQESSNG